MTGMRAGQLRYKINILRVQTSRNEWGESVDPIPAAYISPRCSVRSLGLQEKITAGIDIAKSVKLFTIRYREGLKLSDLVQYNGKVYDIKEIDDPDESRQSLTILAELVE